MTTILDQLNQNGIQPIDPEKDYLSELVGEEKKFKDAAALARAKAESDLMIERLKLEQAELREDLKQARATKRTEELLDQMLALQNKQAPSNEDNQTSETGNKSPQLTTEDVKKLLKEQDTEREQLRNRDLVLDKLQTTFGSSFANKIGDVARQLKVSVDYLDQVAIQNPTAFFKLMGMDEQPKQDVSVLSPPRTAFSTPPITSGKKNWAYYEGLRKKEPDRYHSISIQNEMFAEALKQQDSFYN